MSRQEEATTDCSWSSDHWKLPAIPMGSIQAEPRTDQKQQLHDTRPRPESEPEPSRCSSSPPSLSPNSSVDRRGSIHDAPAQDRMVDRKLRGISLSMIAVNATIGSGLYWTSGQILRVGGPLTASLSFLLSGLLAWAVMQCLTEMLCIWPIPGALSVFVSEFVDCELGVVVGVAYWIFDGFVIYLLTPIVMLLINSFKVEIYGWFEVVGSTIKIACLVIVMVLIGVLMHVWREPLLSSYDQDATDHWAKAFVICLSMASYAYVGVEVVAASALEAKPNDTARPGNEGLISKTVKFSAVYIPILATVAYTLATLLASLSNDIDRCNLTGLSWINSTCPDSNRQDNNNNNNNNKQASVFVAIALHSRYNLGINVFTHVINAFVVFSILACANTNLYVASRTLFGLTTGLKVSSNKLLSFLAWFGETNRRKVPMRAVVFSAVAFMWVPFLQLKNGGPIAKFIEILAKMGTTGVVLVWACECWAFIRFYHCISRHRESLKHHGVGQVRRWDYDDEDYPYRGPGQPFVAYAALVGCIFIIVVSNGAPLWNRFYLTPFLAFFLLPLTFLTLWVLLKVSTGARWTLVDLSNANKVRDLITKLHDIRQSWS
ncbi:hypothetical protein CP532_5991 [Ophiocordyceps camponoti-leonardi (nom. inval.)]|nr:hypothetical protein CP532_5991 [Ophiocordyceps camponoti-leonardi (nom. inval.)]